MRSVEILPRYVGIPLPLRASLLLSVLQVTLFGQSAGSMSIATLYLNAGLENYGVRGAVSARCAGRRDTRLRV